MMAGVVCFEGAGACLEAVVGLADMSLVSGMGAGAEFR